MKRVCTITEMLLFLAVSVFGQSKPTEGTPWYAQVPIAWGQLTEGWQLALFAERQSVFVDEPLNVMLVGRNGNPTTIGVMINKSDWFLADFTIKRVGEAAVRQQRPPKDAIDRLRRASMGAWETQVAPGGTVNFYSVDLAKMHSLGPGTYTIQATFKFPNVPKTAKVPVRSNEITVSVIAR